jgi:hypothetical protein
MTGISAKVDYFRATTSDAKAIQKITEEFYRDDTTLPSIPLYGYAHSLREIQSGAIFCFAPHTATMGVCSQFAGQAITSEMEARAKPSYWCLRSIHDERWRCSRIDIAVDVFDPTFSVEAFSARIAEPSAHSIWRKWTSNKAELGGRGHTLYGGAFESEKRLRIYDKAAEQGVEGDWTRYEMVFSAKRAQEVWERVRECNTDVGFLDVAKGLLASMVSLPDWAEWQSTMAVGAKHSWQEVPRVESDTRQWLLSQVVPTFQKAFNRDGDWRELEWFISQFKRE